MDWDLVITRNRELLLRIVASLFAVAGIPEDGGVSTLRRSTRNYIMRILRPAESALRRLIIIAARDVERPVLSPRGSESLFPRLHGQRPGKRLEKASEGDAMAENSASRPPSFPLVDPLKRFDFSPPRRRPKSVPRITFIGLTELRPIPERYEPSPDDAVDATQLCRRLRSLKLALDDLPKQARRLARWWARISLPSDRPRRVWPLRPGYPPGRRKRQIHEIDEVLKDLQSLAKYSMETANTS